MVLSTMNYVPLTNIIIFILHVLVIGIADYAHFLILLLYCYLIFPYSQNVIDLVKDENCAAYYLKSETGRLPHRYLTLFFFFLFQR